LLEEPEAHREGVQPVSDPGGLTSETSLGGEGDTPAVPPVTLHIFPQPGGCAATSILRGRRINKTRGSTGNESGRVTPGRHRSPCRYHCPYRPRPDSSPDVLCNLGKGTGAYVNLKANSVA